MTDDHAHDLTLPEALAEIERLQRQLAEYEAADRLVDEVSAGLAKARAENKRLQRQLAEYEAGDALADELSAELAEARARIETMTANARLACPLSTECTNVRADLAEARAEIGRLQRLLATAIEVNSKLHDLLAKYTAAEALAHGTLEQPGTLPADAPTTFTWNVPPSGPGHSSR